MVTAHPAVHWHQGWWALFQGYGCAARAYAFACSLDTESCGDGLGLFRRPPNGHTGLGHKVRSYAEANAYQTAIPQEDPPESPYSTSRDIGPLILRSPTNSTAMMTTIAEMLPPALSFNFELGCNPNNVGFLPGLGWRRQRVVVNQDRDHAGRALPPTGNPIAGR